MRRLVTAGATAMALMALAELALVPAIAYASPRVTTHVVARTSGVDVAGQMLSQMQGVQIGSASATVTLNVRGRSQPFRVDFGEYTSGTRGTDPSALAVLALFPIAASAFLRTIRLLTSLGK